MTSCLAAAVHAASDDASSGIGESYTSAASSRDVTSMRIF